ncbi:hypothetical protein PsorP6_016799 [Peronosclerospora sorghi]|uniref:Uncharacterized protein n=1 Tax=Peronosclerospora sorghi TaxID=230839 RepID=A0ACC0WCN8_9STRA|nr:hypothetical protein PsorP6_016799 [Peronosclerospora sorghi]
MRIHLVFLLVSGAYLTGKTCLAVAARSDNSTTEYKDEFESIDDNRSTSSERSLRVRATMDGEDEERGRFDKMKLTISGVSQSRTKSGGEAMVSKFM